MDVQNKVRLAMGEMMLNQIGLQDQVERLQADNAALTAERDELLSAKKPAEKVKS